MVEHEDKKLDSRSPDKKYLVNSDCSFGEWGIEKHEAKLLCKRMLDTINSRKHDMGLQSSGTVGIMLLDASAADPFAVFVNRELEIMTLYSSERLLGRSGFSHLQGPLTDLDTMSALNSAMATSNSSDILRFSLFLYRSDRVGFWDEVLIVPLLPAAAAGVRVEDAPEYFMVFHQILEMPCGERPATEWSAPELSMWLEACGFPTPAVAVSHCLTGALFLQCNSSELRELYPSLLSQERNRLQRLQSSLRLDPANPFRLASALSVTTLFDPLLAPKISKRKFLKSSGDIRVYSGPRRTRKGQTLAPPPKSDSSSAGSTSKSAHTSGDSTKSTSSGADATLRPSSSRQGMMTSTAQYLETVEKDYSFLKVYVSLQSLKKKVELIRLSNKILQDSVENVLTSLKSELELYDCLVCLSPKASVIYAASDLEDSSCSSIAFNSSNLLSNEALRGGLSRLWTSDAASREWYLVFHVQELGPPPTAADLPLLFSAVATPIALVEPDIYRILMVNNSFLTHSSPAQQRRLLAEGYLVQPRASGVGLCGGVGKELAPAADRGDGCLPILGGIPGYLDDSGSLYSDSMSCYGSFRGVPEDSYSDPGSDGSSPYDEPISSTVFPLLLPDFVSPWPLPPPTSSDPSATNYTTSTNASSWSPRHSTIKRQFSNPLVQQSHPTVHFLNSGRMGPVESSTPSFEVIVLPTSLPTRQTPILMVLFLKR